MSIRIALTRLAATPMFTVFSVLSLASGVAITTAVYSVVDHLMLRDLGVPESDRAAFLVSTYGGQARRDAVSSPDFDELRRDARSFSSLSASETLLSSVASTTHAELVPAEAVDGAYFATLRIGATRGRVIQPEDERAAARVAVLSEEFWRTRFASDPDAIGRTIRINGVSFEVVGVIQPGFSGLHGVLRTTYLWIAKTTEISNTKPLAGRGPRDHRTLTVFGRLARGVTEAQASAELSTLASRLDRDFPPPPALAGRGPSDRAWAAKRFDLMHRDDDTSLRRFGFTIVALVGLVLVVACTNLANLVLARGTARQGELAVRMALGASRGRLIWEQCLESLMLAAAGAAASYLMFQAVSAMMTTDFTVGPIAAANLSIRPSLNGPAAAVAIVSTILALVVFGLEPAVQLARTLDIRTALAAGATGVRPRTGRQRMVIRWQVAIAAGFFIVATMFIRGTLTLAAHDSGVELDRIAVATLNFDNGVWDEQRVRRAIDRVVEEGATDPVLESVSASTGLPFGVPASIQVAMAPPDDPEGFNRPPLIAVAVTPAFFTTMGIPLTSGRAFTQGDAIYGNTTVILSELTARSFFHSTQVVGHRVAMRYGGTSSIAEIVGVARDTDTRRLYSERRPLIYLPLPAGRQPVYGITLAARSSGPAARTVAALREAIRKADPDLTVDAIGTGRTILSGPFELLRSLGMGTLYLGGFTLLLSMVGLFGVQSHVVSSRTREIGVRMSVGATARQIRLMVITDGYRPVLEGLALGLWGGLAGRFIARAYMDVEVNVIDPWMLLLTPIPLVLAAFIACYWPASRAASVDPTVALRCE
jgi:predicted permease